MSFLFWLSSWFPFPKPARPTVTASDTEIHYRETDGTVLVIAWADVIRVEIITNDCGPFIEDVFFHFVGTHQSVMIEQGAIGSGQVMKRIYDWPGFQSGPFHDAMCCTNNARFVVWEKSVSKQA